MCVIPLLNTDKLPFVILLQEALCSQAAIDGTCPTLCRSNRVVYQFGLSSYRLSMVESHNYQQTQQHAVCLLMINALDQRGPPRRSRVMEDSCEIFFSTSFPRFFFSHTLLSAKLDDQWGNSPTLWGFRRGL